MVALGDRNIQSENRLTTQTLEIGDDTTVMRSLDWDRDRFDIEFGLQNGTTYNSYLVRGDKVALIDTSHEKFRELYLSLLQGEIDPAEIDYLIVSHTEPDHSGLVKDVLALAPRLWWWVPKSPSVFWKSLSMNPSTAKLLRMATR